MSQAVAVDEFFQGRLMSAIVAGGPHRMEFIEWPIIQNPIVDCACGNQQKARDAGRPGCFDQLERAQHILFDESKEVSFCAAKAAARMVERRVDDRLATLNQ